MVDGPLAAIRRMVENAVRMRQGQIMHGLGSIIGSMSFFKGQMELLQGF